ncbi:barnase inhibitor [Gottfriedia luciferensis]|uniref:Barnase inhibitor n=1 Tax=Gottfriedia luciferensis TaxID=178774 RepID=A0ABX2ZWL1_9BACI|nr:barstar family protein [Gottfriedia luciferensis]ODG92937.1 barnase inhibitor [Gottfriedia luciferensis]
MTNEIVTIDVSDIKTKKDLHILLKEKLSFPDFYGENWDAFWDAITGLVAPLPKKIIFIGWSDLKKALPRDTKIMKECLNDYNNEFTSWKSNFLFN